jgi:sugar/nucleoside kinase (ribokinase family)
MQRDDKLVITIGSANGERVLPIDAPHFRLGTKHTLSPQKTMAGGSSVNHACRLLAQGVQVFPILPVADDRVGRVVVDTLNSAARRASLSVNYDGFFMTGDDVKTPYTTVLTVSGQRTILNEFPDAIVSRFAQHWRQRLAVFEAAYERTPDAVIVGHIHADRGTSQGGQGGGISQSIIERFAEEGVPVFANFGRSQYALGTTRWEPFLDQLSCFQLDIEEMREFGVNAGLASLEDGLEWFRDKCSIVITMERMGAIAQLKGNDAVIIGGPYDLQPEDVTDATGAGDAFAAGIVASALSCPLTSCEALKRGVETGMLWSAYACTTVGGAADCPDACEIERFRERYPLAFQTESKSRERAGPTLRLLDRVFVR